MRTTLLVIATALIGLQAHAWGYHEDRRTYHGQPPVVVHPIEPRAPIYQPAPIYHPAPIFRTSPIYTPTWRTGRWVHTWHGSRFGWWWVAGSDWNFYVTPTYPYPEPQTTVIYEPAPQPVTVVQAPPAPQVTYTEPPAPVSGNVAPPQNGMYYFCESSQLYYPYAKTCSERWKAVPSQPN